jgi:hypothetical protein
MKLTTWNIEWLDHAWGVLSGRYASGRRRDNKILPTAANAQKQLDAVTTQIQQMDPDILFVCEAVAHEEAMQDFVTAHLPDYDLVKRQPGQPYHVRGGQGLWFLLRKALADRVQPELLDITVWRHFTVQGSPSARPDGKWAVAMPRLETIADVTDVPVSRRVLHTYYRHPQTLRMHINGQVVEVIGTHLKSKFTSGRPRARRANEDFEAYAQEPTVGRYLANSHAARVKLTSEALNIRAYIDQRFRQESTPSVMVVGDLNDGPGKELLEREYLLHDLITNLQGDIFHAERFLNHALFDQPGHLRWTVYFEDTLQPDRAPHILLDHILFTQAFTRYGTGPLRVPAQAGFVEHRIHEEVEAVFGTGVSSDHRAVSTLLHERE